MKNQYKKLFPIFQKHPHLIYLDSAASSQKPKNVIDSMAEFLKNQYAPLYRGMYNLSEDATERFEEIRKKTAKFFGARDASEVVFTKSATEAVNLVSYSWLRQHLQKGDEILINVFEHHANFVPWQSAALELGAKFYCVSAKKNGEFNEKLFLKSITKKTKFIALTHASNVTGEILPIKTLIAKIRKKNPFARILIDGAQAAGRLPIAFDTLGADFFVCSAHKFYGPSGIGILLIRKELHAEMQPFLFGGAMIREVTEKSSTFREVPYLFEGGTQNAEGVIGLGAAIDFIEYIGIKKIQSHEKKLLQYAFSLLKDVGGISLIGPREVKRKIGLISFYHPTIHAHEIAAFLAQKEIAVRAGHHCAMPLHASLGLSASVRMSFSIFTGKKDILQCVQRLLPGTPTNPPSLERWGRGGAWEHKKDSPYEGMLKNPSLCFSYYNESCGDKAILTFRLDLRKNIIDAKFEHSGCNLSYFACSLFLSSILKKPYTLAKNMNSSSFLSNFPFPISSARISCALLPLNALKQEKGGFPQENLTKKIV